MDHSSVTRLEMMWAATAAAAVEEEEEVDDEYDEDEDTFEFWLFCCAGKADEPAESEESETSASIRAVGMQGSVTTIVLMEEGSRIAEDKRSSNKPLFGSVRLWFLSPRLFLVNPSSSLEDLHTVGCGVLPKKHCFAFSLTNSSLSFRNCLRSPFLLRWQRMVKIVLEDELHREMQNVKKCDEESGQRGCGSRERARLRD